MRAFRAKRGRPQRRALFAILAVLGPYRASHTWFLYFFVVQSAARVECRPGAFAFFFFCPTAAGEAEEGATAVEVEQQGGRQEGQPGAEQAGRVVRDSELRRARDYHVFRRATVGGVLAGVGGAPAPSTASLRRKRPPRGPWSPLSVCWKCPVVGVKGPSVKGLRAESKQRKKRTTKLKHPIARLERQNTFELHNAPDHASFELFIQEETARITPRRLLTRASSPRLALCHLAMVGPQVRRQRRRHLVCGRVPLRDGDGSPAVRGRQAGRHARRHPDDGA